MAERLPLKVSSPWRKIMWWQKALIVNLEVRKKNKKQPWQTVGQWGLGRRSLVCTAAWGCCCWADCCCRWPKVTPSGRLRSSRLFGSSRWYGMVNETLQTPTHMQERLIAPGPVTHLKTGLCDKHLSGQPCRWLGLMLLFQSLWWWKPQRHKMQCSFKCRLI